MFKLFAALVALMFATSFGVMTGCEEEGPFERAGENIDDGVDEVGDDLNDAADEIEDDLDDNDVDLDPDR